MRSFTLQSPSDGEVWVRKEEDGCIMYSNGRYAEGNRTAYEVLELLAQGKALPGVISELAARYGVDTDDVRSGIRAMFAAFSASGWFIGFCDQLCSGKH